jgi:hypothetical protein
MTISPTPRVTGFADAGTPEDPIVCVHVEAGELGVWIGRRHPGSETEVVTDVASIREITVQEARRILESWPATQGNTGDALQFAAWQGRRHLIAPRLHERVTG